MSSSTSDERVSVEQGFYVIEDDYGRRVREATLSEKRLWAEIERLTAERDEWRQRFWDADKARLEACDRWYDVEKARIAALPDWPMSSSSGTAPTVSDGGSAEAGLSNERERLTRERDALVSSLADLDICCKSHMADVERLIRELKEAQDALHDAAQNVAIENAEVLMLRAALEEVMRVTGKLTYGTTHYEGCADDHPMCRIWCIAQGAVSRTRPSDETTVRQSYVSLDYVGPGPLPNCDACGKPPGDHLGGTEMFCPETSGCVCGQPNNLGTVHRKDGPCYQADCEHDWEQQDFYLRCKKCDTTRDV